jgi:hypothetical protein
MKGDCERLHRWLVAGIADSARKISAVEPSTLGPAVLNEIAGDVTDPVIASFLLPQPRHETAPAGIVNLGVLREDRVC